jgi:hypothetical protein
MHGPEFYEKKEIRKYLDSIGAWHCLPATYGYGKSGAPDIIACVLLPDKVCWNRFVGIEVKREGAVPTKIQERRMEEIKKAGGIAVWGTAEKVIRELKELFG